MNPGNGYHGLKNQGATCYLNSVLQVLYMTRDFREAVERKKSETECLDLQLSKLFDNLTQNTAHTREITQKLGIRVHEQRDAAEYFEKILSDTSPEASQIFQGQLTHKNICCKCDKETNTGGPFLSLPLALKDSYSGNFNVVDGIEEFFKESFVSGDNQMYCEQCDDKEDATMKCDMTHYPECLMLLLKRFEFDYHYMEYVKITCCVGVPFTLQIPENQTYELYGFVDHFGDLRGGHYTATIKSQDDEGWYNFNDTRVTKLPDNQQLKMENMRSSSAYLLFYRKQKDKEVSTNGGFQSETSPTRKRKQDKEAAEVDKRQKSAADNQINDQNTKGNQSKRQRRKKNKISQKSQDEETSNNVRQIKSEDQEGTQEQDPGRTDQQGDKEKPVVDVKIDEHTTTEANEREKASVSGKSDNSHGFQNNEGETTLEVKHTQARPKCKDSGKLMDAKKEQRSDNVVVELGNNVDLRQKKTNDGKESKKGETRRNKKNKKRQRKSGNDSSGISESQCSEGLEDQSNIGLDDDRQNREEFIDRQTSSAGSKNRIENRTVRRPRGRICRFFCGFCGFCGFWGFFKPKKKRNQRSKSE